MEQNNGAAPGGAPDLGRVPDAREEGGFLPKETLAALDPEVRARVVALARENAGLREQNEKLFGRLTAAPQNGAPKAAEPEKPRTQEEAIKDELAYPTDGLVEYEANAMRLLRAAATADATTPEGQALKAEAAKIDERVLSLARRELGRREVLKAVRPELEKDRAERKAEDLGRNLFQPIIERWGESALSDRNSELAKLAHGYYADRLAEAGGLEKVDKAQQLRLLRWSFDTAEADLYRAGVTPLRSRGRLEEMGGAGGGGSAQSGSAAELTNQILALQKQGKTTEAHTLDLQMALMDRSYKPHFRPS